MAAALLHAVLIELGDPHTVQVPNANADAERFVRTLREECLDWLLIVGWRHLERALHEYVEHYNRERPHRAPIWPARG